MKKRYMVITAMCLCASLLAGCQETPKDSIVREKGAASLKKYESADEALDAAADSSGAADGSQEGAGEGADAGLLRELLGAPERYENQASYEDGALVINTDAEVILPEASAMHTYGVSAMEADQDMIDRVTEAFFEGDKVYHMYSYTEWTKEDYQEEITRLKKYKAEGNLDPYDYGTDEEGNLMFDIDALIARDEEDMKNAPDEALKEEVKPSFGLEYVDGKGDEAQKAVDEDFWGIVETSHGNYEYHIKHEIGPGITIHIKKQREDLPDPREYTAWQEGQYLLDREGDESVTMTEERMKEMAGISLEDAQEMAEEPVKKLGWDWEVYGWDYAVFRRGEDWSKEDSAIDGGYYFHFTRVLDGAPLTYTDSYGGGLEDMDSTLEPWGYERCDVVVGDDGIQSVEICCPYEVGEIQTKNVKMMDFGSIMKIYEQMMEVSNADISDYEQQRTYNIRKITLGYSRIYDPSTENDKGLLVPVWDFFGGFDIKGEEYESKNSGEHSNQSFLTVNAVDGTVIDRGLGY